MFTKLYCTYENLAKIINIFMQNVVEYGFSFRTINNFFDCYVADKKKTMLL